MDPVAHAKKIPLESIKVIPWPSENEEKEHFLDGNDSTSSDVKENDKISSVGPSATHPTFFTEMNSSMLTTLEILSPDVSASILQYLSVQEISRLGRVSKSLYQASRQSEIWKKKFETRWNYKCSSNDWFHAYQKAYWNTDDLWVTHWNIVEPCDGLGVGRCCIEPNKKSRPLSTVSPLSLCPRCRYHPAIHPTAYEYPETITNEAQAIASATRIRLAQQRQLTDDYANVSPYRSERAEQAFAKSATLHRAIDTDQYQTASLNFVKDLLFFQTHEDPKELDDLKELYRQDEFGLYQVDEASNLPEACETALHSWHLCHFTNPDYERPLVWRVSIMRKDCFTVYPSEGYLMPGESQVVTFCVRPFGSLLAHATQQINAHREGVDPILASIYAEEAHLPPAPFLIHYHFATEHQQKPNSPNSLSTRPPLGTPWHRSGRPDQPVRIMYLSAHVNAKYSLSEFQRRTCAPFSILDRRIMAYCAPQLAEFHHTVSNHLNGLALEEPNASIEAHSYRTEGPCGHCGISWVKDWKNLAKRLSLENWRAPLDNRWSEEIIHRIHDLLCYLIEKKQRRTLYQWETIIDLLLIYFSPTKNSDSQRSAHPYFLVPWRHAGVYRDLLCTDSVFTKEPHVNDLEILTFWKPEPKYLEAFAHLAHSPGKFCLGPQEDPNHLRMTSTIASRYARRQRGCVTDMFFDDPVSGLQAALCVVSAPRSLMVHGIWDRVAYPGNLIRRPKLVKLPPLHQKAIPALNLTTKNIDFSCRRLQIELQNMLDLDSLFFVEEYCSANSKRKSNLPETYPLSLRNYLQNVPPPGSGRFALCEVVDKEDQTLAVQEVTLTTYENDREFGIPTPQPQRSDIRVQHAGPFNIARPPGPRLLTLLWVLSSHMGWTVDDNQGTASVYVDRRILIGAQWLSISLMAAPLFWTLVARSARWIPTTPVDYPLEALPFHVETELRFLSEQECLQFAVGILVAWLLLGRHIERYTSRDFLRAMLEHLPSEEHINQGMLKRVKSRSGVGFQRLWDSVCPLFLQRAVFVPKWNRRTQEDLMKHIAFWRCTHGHVASSTFQALFGGGFVVCDSHDSHIHLGEVSWFTKVSVAILASLASFSASSPHFVLNLLAVFSSSISLGLSMSLQSMETGRAGVNVSETGGVIETLSLVTIVILGFLVGQLVGGSGGVLFLAEFVVTSISLVLGGAGTISAHAMESWGTFFCLGVAAFWGYLFGRVSIMEGIKQKRSGFSSIMLCFSLVVLAMLWTLALLVWKWENAMELVVDRPHSKRGIDSGWDLSSLDKLSQLQ